MLSHLNLLFKTMVLWLEEVSESCFMYLTVSFITLLLVTLYAEGNYKSMVLAICEIRVACEIC